MIEVTILIPQTDPEGKRWSGGTLKTWREWLAVRHGGFTLGQSSVGGWMNAQGRVMLEENQEYTVAISGLKTLPGLLSTIRLAKGHFNQEAIYIRYLGRAELI